MTDQSFSSAASLLTAADSARPSVKVYNLYPELGRIIGYGANRVDRDELIDAIEDRRWGRRDCIYLLLKRMSINYVGTTQNVRDHIADHHAKRPDWDRIIVFYCIADILNTNIAEYAEYTLYVLLAQRGFTLQDTPPSKRYERNLSPSNQLIAREIVQEIERILVLVDTAEPTERAEARRVSGASLPFASQHRTAGLAATDPIVAQDVKALSDLVKSGRTGIEVELERSGAHARGRYTGYGLEVYAGSQGTARVKKHFADNTSYFETRERLRENGIIEIAGDRLTFLKPYIFASPTAAAQLLCAASVPGPLHWKSIEDHTPLRDIKKPA